MVRVILGVTHTAPSSCALNPIDEFCDPRPDWSWRLTTLRFRSYSPSPPLAALICTACRAPCSGISRRRRGTEATQASRFRLWGSNLERVDARRRTMKASERV
jgi:hypothetical protein